MIAHATPASRTKEPHRCWIGNQYASSYGQPECTSPHFAHTWRVGDSPLSCAPHFRQLYQWYHCAPRGGTFTPFAMFASNALRKPSHHALASGSSVSRLRMAGRSSARNISDGAALARSTSSSAEGSETSGRAGPSSPAAGCAPTAKPTHTPRPTKTYFMFTMSEPLFTP